MLLNLHSFEDMECTHFSFLYFNPFLPLGRHILWIFTELFWKAAKSCLLLFCANPRNVSSNMKRGDALSCVQQSLSDVINSIWWKSWSSSFNLHPSNDNTSSPFKCYVPNPFKNAVGYFPHISTSPMYTILACVICNQTVPTVPTALQKQTPPRGVKYTLLYTNQPSRLRWNWGIRRSIRNNYPIYGGGGNIWYLIWWHSTDPHALSSRPNTVRTAIFSSSWLRP